VTGTLRTAHWGTDEPIDLAWPDDWSVTVHWPSPQQPLSADDIRASLDAPVESPTLEELARGKRRPLVIIDDLTRPTPSWMALEPMLDTFAAAGIPLDAVTILLATGTHPPPLAEAIPRKIGERAATACRVVVHVDQRDCVQVGTTSFGTPIVVDRTVRDADLVLGIGGVYPNNTAGFGGGFKLALGVLGRRSITHLHLKHRSAGWGGDNGELRFRQDLEEIAAAIGLRTTVTMHVDAEARPVRVRFGDWRVFYDEERAWAKAAVTVPGPGEADVVIANAYPSDATLVAAYQKALGPLRVAPLGASRVVLASCFMGEGGHGLFPLSNRPSVRTRLGRQAMVQSPAAFASSVLGAARRRAMSRLTTPPPGFDWPILLLRPGSAPKPELPRVGGIEPVGSWSEVVETIRRQQGDRRGLRVVVYPCSPLQVLDVPADVLRFAGE
jgi:nickel-dependent lactate racemase